MENIKFTPLGGLGEVGKNLLLFEINSKIYLIDAGIKFSTDPEIDFILPDLDFLEKIKDKIAGIFITHGHEDHVGALSKLAFLNVPIYCPPLAKEIIRKKLYKDQFHLLKEVTINKKFQFEDFSISWFPVVHSIPDSCGLIIQTKNINIIHTGDFRFDANPVFGKNTNFNSIKERIDNKCDVLFSDSTNALVDSESFSEKEIEKTFTESFKENRRIIICTFASQISRIQMAINVAKKFNKKIVLMGSTLKKNLKITKGLNIIYDYENVISSNKNSKNKDKDFIYFVTGSQGEDFSVLNRLSSKKYNNLKIDKNDLILMSSSVIPGNEEKVFGVIHRLQGLGAEVRFNNFDNKLHVSGHSNKSELGNVIKTLNPKYFIPIHGNNDMLEAHKNIAISKGVDKKNIFILSNGDNLVVNSDKAKTIPPEKIIDEVILRDNPLYNNEIDTNIFEKNMISIIVNAGKTIENKDINIQIFDNSNNMRIKQIIEKYILESNLNNNLELWSEITKQFNDEIYKLVLEEFNKKYVIKSIFIEK
jgi:ribonuclease J